MSHPVVLCIGVLLGQPCLVLKLTLQFFRMLLNRPQMNVAEKIVSIREGSSSLGTVRLIRRFVLEDPPYGAGADEVEACLIHAVSRQQLTKASHSGTSVVGRTMQFCR